MNARISKNSITLLAVACLAVVMAPPRATAQVLPPPPAKQPGIVDLVVKEFRFIGNQAFPASELTKITAPFTNRKLTSADLEEARRAVTLYYVTHGFVNSGVVIPDQDPVNGVVKFQIVEGVLSHIDVRDNNWLSDSYIRDRVQRWSSPPLNLNSMRDGLQLLRQNPNIKQLNAELLPGTAPGEGILDLRVVDQQPFRVALEIDNHRPPSVGAEEVSLLLSDLNLTGNGDPLNIRYGVANSGGDNGWKFSGVENIAGDYALPVNRYDTTIGLQAGQINTSIVEEPFTLLGIESETMSYGVRLRHPLYRTPNRELALSLGLDRRRNETTLLGEPFNISPGAIDGRMTESVLRFSQEWTDRGLNYVLALRSTFNLGVDVFDVTDSHINGDPNAFFFSWLGQAQYVRRLFNTQNQLVIRLTGQWSNERLLALEQMSVGGGETVRGYRENQLVRDRAIVSSVEFRVPVFFDKSGVGIIQLAPFFDFGGAWNIGGSTSPTTIYSTGVGILITPNKHINAQLYWGYRLRHLRTPQNDAQDLGLHFRVNIAAF